MKAEHDTARRAAELAELRSGLEGQLGAARREALAVRDEMARVKRDLDSLLTDEFLGVLEADLRRGVPAAAAVGRKGLQVPGGAGPQQVCCGRGSMVLALLQGCSPRTNEGRMLLGGTLVQTFAAAVW